MEKNQQIVLERIGNLAVLYPCDKEEFQRTDPVGEEYEYTLEEMLSHGRAE